MLASIIFVRSASLTRPKTGAAEAGLPVVVGFLTARSAVAGGGALVVSMAAEKGFAVDVTFVGPTATVDGRTVVMVFGTRDAKPEIVVVIVCWALAVVVSTSFGGWTGALVVGTRCIFAVVPDGTGY